VSDPERLFLDNRPRIERIVATIGRRNRLTKEETEDFGSIVNVKLIEKDYQVLREFCGKCTLGFYLKVVIQRAYQDYRNQLLGKWRPSAEAKRLGKVAERLDRLLHRDGMTLDEACAASLPEDREEMRRLAPLLPARHKRKMEDVEQLDEMPSREASAEVLLIERERAAAAAERAAALAQALGSLSADDRLLVQMHMFEGVKLATLARMYGIDERRMYRRWELILRQLRKELTESGYDDDPGNGH